MARLLIVEDEAVVARDLQVTLGRLGYAVVAAVATGEAAVQQAEMRRPDLVLMDIRLNGPLDGIDAAGEIRERFAIPVVYLTAHADPETLERAGVTAPFGYVLKPFDERDLHTTVEMALYRHLAERRLQESEEALRQERDALQQLARERDLANRELEKTNCEIEHFVYGISHDLKTPLVTLMNFLGILREDLAEGRSEAVAEDLERMERAARRMSMLVSDLLAFNRLGRVPNRPEDVDLADLVRDVCESCRGLIEDAGAQLAIEVDELPRVWADRTRLIQVLENLLTNAVKYGCRENDARIAIGGRGEGDEVRLFVRDNGPGIPGEHQARIFEVFQRLATDGDGTGVGLAIVQRVAQAHGGRAWVESEPDHGATFWFALPQRRPEGEPP